ncbi:MAG: hypothetical protein NPMRTH1_510001 [Nitrosopumilales archaeon]|nr:MAG: hypothetical protein NPMRTH1_510001 [Nitrosopumilales archaeon]
MAQEVDPEGRLVSMILEANKNIRYACICDSDGKILWNSRRNDIQSLISLEDTKASLKMALENWKKRDNITAKIGKGKYSIVGYEKLKRVTVPMRNNHLLYVHVEGDKPEYIGDIMKIVDWVAEHP